MNRNISVKIVNTSPHPLPKYQTEYASGVDLYAFLTEKVILKPLERKLIPTGIFIEMPDFCEAQIRPRSGMALQKGITLLNTPGTIDADYRGEIKVLLVNLSNENQTIEDSDRIAQMVFSNYYVAHWEPVSTLSHTKRNTKGYGSTGE